MWSLVLAATLNSALGDEEVPVEETQVSWQDAVFYKPFLFLLRCECESQEILDERETWYFQSKEQFGNDLATMRNRWNELKDAPPLADAVGLPDSSTLWELLQFNRKCQENICNGMQPSWGEYELNSYLAELKQTERVYDKLLNAASTYWYVANRRQALKVLRDDLLGADAYYSGSYPPIVPVWRLPIVD